MKEILLIPVVLFVIIYNGVHGLTSSRMEDGDFLKIVSVPSGNVLTLSGMDASDGNPLILAPWASQSNQKFLAVEALVAGDSFLLMPQRQRYPWQRFIRNGGTSPYRNRHDDLPDWTAVLEGNTNTGAVTQDARDGKLYQQWRAVKVETNSNKKAYLIKNRQNNQCLQAPGASTVSQVTSTTTQAPVTTTQRSSFFSNVWSSIRGAFGSSSSDSGRSSRSSSQQSGTSSVSSTTNVILAPCNPSDQRQHWQLESLAYEY